MMYYFPTSTKNTDDMPYETRAYRPLFSEARPYAMKEPPQTPGVRRANRVRRAKVFGIR